MFEEGNYEKRTNKCELQTITTKQSDKQDQAKIKSLTARQRTTLDTDPPFSMVKETPLNPPRDNIDIASLSVLKNKLAFQVVLKAGTTGWLKFSIRVF